MNQKNKPLGVMGSDYSIDRQKKKSLIYRYKTRAFETFKIYQKHNINNEFPKILDFGTADGFTLAEAHLLLNAHSSIGIEYSKELIKSAEKLPPNCSIIQGDVTEEIELLSGISFDLVTALAILEHLDDPRKLFEQAFQRLKPGALLIATCPSPTWDKISGKLNLHKEDFHAVDFNRKKFYKMAKEIGFQPLQYKKFMSAPLGFLPYLNISIYPRFSHAVDKMIRTVKFLNWTFVNQIFVARKPK
jgi:SAM-dependent methyltransferase